MLNEWSTIDSIKKISPDWKIVPLQKFSSSDKNSFVNGPFGSDLLSSELVDEGHPVIYVRDIKDGRYQRKSGVCVTTEKHQALSACQVNYGDVVIAKVGDPPCEAAVYDVNESGVVTQDVIRIKTAEFGRSQFLAFLLNSDIGKRQVKRIKIAGTRERVSLTDFKKLKLPFPPVIEQNRIAQILFTWDQAIATTERLLDLTRQQKKALMQQLLTGKKRFPEFEGEWKSGVLGDVANIDSGFAFKSDDFSDDDNAVPIIRMSDFKSGALDLCSSAKVMADVLFGLDRFALKPNDFVFGMSGSLSNYAWVKESNLPCYLNQRVGRIVAKDNADQMFVTYLYLSDRIQQSILDKAAGAAQLNISVTDLRTMSIKYPCLQEQKQIAQVLTTSNQEIETLQSQLDGLKQEKKALMHALLTGKRRVNVMPEEIEG